MKDTHHFTRCTPKMNKRYTFNGDKLKSESEMGEMNSNIVKRKYLNGMNRSSIECGTENTNGEAENVYRYHCSKCDYKANHCGTFKRHCLSHIQKLYKCEDCFFETNRKDNFIFHRNRHLEPKSYNCVHCSFKSNFISCLNQHVCRPFSCLKCSFRTRSEEELKKHNSTHSPPSIRVSGIAPGAAFERGPKIWKCPKCSFETKAKGSLKLHSLVHGQRTFTCSQCDYASNFKKLFEIHEEQHVSFRKSTQLKCSECPYVTSRMCSLQRHSLQHAKVKHYKCSKCDYKSFRQDLLNNHQLSHLNKTIFNCPMCDFKIDSEPQFREHLNTHDNLDERILKYLKNKVYKCSLCKYKSKTENALEKHTLKHQNSKSSSTGKPIRILTPTRSYTPWPCQDKKEIYWCDFYARHISHPKHGSTERRREMLLGRGIVDRSKVELTPSTRFHSIVANMKMGKTKITLGELREIENSVEEYIKKEGSFTSKD